MARKPTVLELASGKGTRQRIWEAIRARGQADWMRAEIALAAKVECNVVHDYLRGLLAAGYVREVRREDLPGRVGVGASRGRYVLARDCGVEAPRVRRDGTPVTHGLAQEQMWRTLCRLQGDTNARELAAYASTQKITVSPVAAADYLRTLHQAGYLAVSVECRRNPHNPRLAAARRYRLIPARKTGPKPPMVCRVGAVFDPNESRIVWQPQITEEDVIYGR